MAAPKTHGLTADSPAGRILLALRRGEHEACQLEELFNGSLHPAYGLLKKGFISKEGMIYRLTEAGRAACPTRRRTAQDLENEAAARREANQSAQRKHRAVNPHPNPCPGGEGAYKEAACA